MFSFKRICQFDDFVFIGTYNVHDFHLKVEAMVNMRHKPLGVLFIDLMKEEFDGL